MDQCGKLIVTMCCILFFFLFLLKGWEWEESGGGCVCDNPIWYCACAFTWPNLTPTCTADVISNFAVNLILDRSWTCGETKLRPNIAVCFNGKCTLTATFGLVLLQRNGFCTIFNSYLFHFYCYLNMWLLLCLAWLSGDIRFQNHIFSTFSFLRVYDCFVWLSI
jgi:hypothetical protein